MMEIVIMGMLLGGIYGIIGFGFSLIFTGVRNTVNLSHGQLVLLGSYLSFAVVTSFKLDPLLSSIIVLPISFCLGFLLQYGLVNRVVLKGPGIRILILLGAGLVIENMMLLIFNPDPRSLAPYAPYAIKFIDFFGVHIPIIYLVNFFAALVVMTLVYLFIKYTYVGMAIRATSEDPLCVHHFGINHEKIYAITFALGSVLAAIGGVLIGLTFAFEPALGFNYLGIAFSVVVIGGVGSIRGSFLGGIVLGVIQALASYYIGITYSYLVSNLITLVILLIKPEGVFGYEA
jgi:branched-chain amino acid transport system permease protein